MDPVFPGALTLAMLALLLGFAPHGGAKILFLSAGVVTALWAFPLATLPIALIIALCWCATFAMALSIWFLPPRQARIFVIIALACAVVAGLSIQQSSATFAPAVCLALALYMPASFSVARGWAIVPRVGASWIAAVGLLSAALPLAVSHPGFVADHRE